MGSWIVLFFVVALALMANTVQIETRERRANLEIEGVVDTLVNIIDGQHRHYLYANPTAAAGFITSDLSGTLDWLDDRDCGGTSCYRVVEVSPRNVQVVYRARSPAIAARIALHFGDMACVGSGGGVCRAAHGDPDDHVILDLEPVEKTPLLSHFMPRSNPNMEEGGLFYMSKHPSSGGAAERGLYIDGAEVLNVPKALSLGITATSNRMAGSLSQSQRDAYQDHTEVLWGDRIFDDMHGVMRDPKTNFGEDYTYEGDGVLIEIAPEGNRDEVRYTRVQAGDAAIVLQAGPYVPGDPGHRAVFSAGRWDGRNFTTADPDSTDNHVIDKDANLHVHEVLSAENEDMVVHVLGVRGRNN